MARSSRAAVWLARLAVLSLLLTLLGATFSVRAPRAAAQDQPADPTQADTATVNVELILDSSGSMAELTTDGEPRIDAAKSVLNEVIEAIPEDRPGVNVGFRVFGHEGNNTEAGKAESCASTELRVPIEGVNKGALREQTEAYQPVGWTPITLALTEAAQDFEPGGESITNALVMVTDGLETCDGDPCAAATAIAESEVQGTIYVIGLGNTPEELNILRCIADNSGGQLFGAGNAGELSNALFTILEELQVVVTTGSFEIEEIGGLFPSATLTGSGGATDSNPQGQQLSFTIDNTTGINRIDEMPVGVYRLSFRYPSGQEKVLNVNIEADRLTTLRGSILELPQGQGEIYAIRDLAGVLVYQDQLEIGTRIWVLPDLYSIDLQEVVGNPILFYARVQTLPGQVTHLEVFTSNG